MSAGAHPYITLQKNIQEKLLLTFAFLFDGTQVEKALPCLQVMHQELCIKGWIVTRNVMHLVELCI